MMTLSIKDVRSRLLSVHGSNIRILSYNGMNTKTNFECYKHGLFQATPMNVTYNKSGCPRCWWERRGPQSRKTHKAYVEEVRMKFDGRITVGGQYVTALTKIEHKCSKGHIWMATPNTVLAGYGCTWCGTGSYRRKAFTVQGREFILQGREIFALRELANEIDLDSVATQSIRIPYIDRDRERQYIPDFVVDNRHVIEVKSPTSAGMYDTGWFNNLKRKRRGCLRAGYSFELRIYDGAGRRLRIPRNWFKLTRLNFKQALETRNEISSF